MLDSEPTTSGTDDNEPNPVTNDAGADEVTGGAAGRGPARAAEPAPIPAVLFQAPQVLFQPPQPYVPAASAARGPAGVGSGAPDGSGPNGSAGPAGDRDDSGDEDEEEAAPASRARRSSGRAATGRAAAGRTAGARTARTRAARDSGREDRDRDAAGSDADEDEDTLAAPPEDTAVTSGAGEQGGEGRAGEGTASEDDADEPGSARRRRRRDRRSRGRAEAEISVTDPDPDAGAEGDSGSASGDADDDDESEGGSTSRRRRRKRRRGSADSDVSAPDDPPDTVVHVRAPHNLADDVRSVKGSTRLEAKKQRRREGRESGRRRPPVVTESEFLARRESVERTMVVRQRGDRTQIAVMEDGVLVEHYVNRTTHQSYVGNVYLGKVQNVLPSMEAAFVDIGKGRNAVLYAGEVNFDASGLEGQPKRIEAALKPGQSVIVQVTKDPVGHKGARLTSQVSLPGRYLVYVPGASMTGISRKLPDTERNRLKHILKKVTPDNGGVIVRTAAEGAAEAELERDVTRLAAQWESIAKKAKTASAPALLYGEPDLTIRVVRDVFNEDFSELIVSGDDGWGVIDEYVRYVAPHLAERVVRWEPEAADGGYATGSDDVFGAYRIDEQLAKALERKVWLPSGGSLVIDRTEAMTVVDVNTGKFTGQGGNLEETVTRNNLEAAEEIVRQLRLRDVGGIVVIDFIDMVLEANRDLVMRRLLECLARDRTKHQVAEVTSLGLVQMTRKRVGAGLLEAFSEPCETCNGRGVVVRLDPAEPGHHGNRRGGNGNGSAGNGNGHGGNGHGSPGHSSPGHSGNGHGAAADAGRAPALAAVGSSAGDAGNDGGQSGGSERSGRRNRRDRGRGGQGAVAQAIAGMASATLAVPSDADVLSVDAAASLAPAVTDEAPASVPVATEAIAAPAAAGEGTPADDAAPAQPRRRTRSGRASARRVATPDEPVAVVVPSPPAETAVTRAPAPAPQVAESAVTGQAQPAQPVDEVAPQVAESAVTEQAQQAEAAQPEASVPSAGPEAWEAAQAAAPALAAEAARARDAGDVPSEVIQLPEEATRAQEVAPPLDAVSDGEASPAPGEDAGPLS
ncbi:MAG TPA: Rne/Rng family ribonuclease [Trebonia sp.]|jgi:ribonuclease E|nr:Rne/Rng family ribonuclease [Trebonia sp.]